MQVFFSQKQEAEQKKKSITFLEQIRTESAGLTTISKARKIDKLRELQPRSAQKPWKPHNGRNTSVTILINFWEMNMY